MNDLFSSQDEIKDLVRRADNKDLTKELTSYFQNLKATRVPFYLTLEELEKILFWKLRKQHGRQFERRKLNTNENVIAITKAAFSVSHEVIEVETALRLNILTALSGVEIPVASAILTLCYPMHYSVIDFRNWYQLYGGTSRKGTYTTREYTEYLKLIRAMASKFDVTTQEIDIAIWQRDIERDK